MPPPSLSPIKRFAPAYANLAGYRQYGLKYQDLLVETKDVDEALRRLPMHEQVMRARRIKLASDLALKQTILPKEQWTKPEEDVAYLTPYLDEVFTEKRDREAFYV